MRRFLTVVSDILRIREHRAFVAYLHLGYDIRKIDFNTKWDITRLVASTKNFCRLKTGLQVVLDRDEYHLDAYKNENSCISPA